MLVPLIAAEWWQKILAGIFIGLFDSVAYILLAGGYTIFYAISQIDIFGTGSGLTIYEEIASRIYTALSIVMVFVFAYYLIMMIIDPDGGQGKSTTQLVKETIISFILVIILPTIFGYMSLFQKHVITNNTIGNIILGGNGATENSYGKQISMIVFSSFYHPDGTMYNDYFNNDGEFIGESEAIKVCKEGGANDEICTSYAAGLQAWVNSPNDFTIHSISHRTKLSNAVNDEGGMYYMWVLSTIAAIAAAWFFFSYALDVGTRAVKLGFLQLIAPIPVLIKIFPVGKKTYDAWFAEIKKCYLEIFVRLAVIFFIVKLCTMVPMFIDAIFSSISGIFGGLLIKAIATVVLILGLLKFAKEAPQLFKTIFASGGGLFAGIDFKPGMRRRVTENEYAMRGLSTGLGAIGGVGASVMAAHNAYKNYDAQGDTDALPAGLVALGSGIRALPRGVIAGGRRGFSNTPSEFGLRGMRQSLSEGLSSAQSSEVRAQNRRDEYGGILHPIQSASRHIDEGGKNLVESITNLRDTVLGLNLNNAAVDTIKKATSTIDNYLDLAKTGVKPFEEAFDDLRKKILSGEKVVYNGVEYTANGSQGMTSMQRYMSQGGRRNAQGHYWNPNIDDFDANYDPTRDAAFAPTQATSSLKDLEKIFNKAKNDKIAETISSKYKEGGATYMATLNRQLARELGNLGAKEIKDINDKIEAAGLTHNGNNIKNISQLLDKLSDKNVTLSAEDIATLKDVKSHMSNISKNIVIAEQAKSQEKKQDNKDGK